MSTPISKLMKLALGFLPIFGTAASAQSVSVQAKLSDRCVTVTPVSDNIIKVTNAAHGQQVPGSRASVLSNPISAAAVYTAGPSSQSIQTVTGLEALVNTATGQVLIDGGANRIIADSGERFTQDGKQHIKLFTTAEGSFYGAGERGHKLNMRGDTLVMYNRQNYGYQKGDPRISQMNITMPLVVSSDGFAIVFDDYAAAQLIIGDNGTIEYITESPDAVSYYYVYGQASIADVVQQLSALTGRQPLPPLWSLGYITSKYGYHDEQETLGAIDSLKQRGYPVDGIVLDLYWYGKEQDMGRLDWEPEQWPDAPKMLKQLKDENVNLIAISQPYVLRNGKGVDNYNFLSANGMLVADSTGAKPQEVEIWVGDGGMLDVSNPATRQWLANRYKELTDMGVTGWWGDLGEPEVHPESGMHANGKSARLYHNQYGNDWSQIIYDMWGQEYPDSRLVTMMRGGTTGLQRYSVFPWSTDVARSWEGMQPQVTIMLNSGLSGLGYMGHDVGGFAVDKENPEDAELYVRWLQLGLFSPMLRTHAQYKAEPYHYEQYASIILPLIKERYRWLPYNYTLAYENASMGYPLVRPLNFYEPGVNAYDGIDDEYLWGSEVLVAPVMKQGATEREVTFPQGTWVDYRNPAVTYAGGSTITYPAPLDVLPLFVKAGAFLPMADYPMESTADYDPAKLTVEYYPVDGVKSHYTLYDDNRLSASSLASGQYRLTTFDGDSVDGVITVGIASEGTYEGAPKQMSITLVFNGVDGKHKRLVADGCKAKLTTVGTYAATVITYDPSQAATIKLMPK